MLFDFHLKDVFPALNIPNTLDYEYELYAFIVHLVNIVPIFKIKLRDNHLIQVIT